MEQQTIINKKKKILLLCDDLRFFSGISTMAKEMVLGIIHKYDVVNIAGLLNHPEKGKVLDLSQATKEAAIANDPSKNYDNVYLKLYCTDGYGNADILKEVIAIEKPDAIVHFTDPRYWFWLYQMEHELRQQLPLCYINIWDDLGYPMYNKSYYESCDALFAISRQTENINKQVLGNDKYITLDELIKLEK